MTLEMYIFYLFFIFLFFIFFRRILLVASPGCVSPLSGCIHTAHISRNSPDCWLIWVLFMAVPTGLENIVNLFFQVDLANNDILTS